VVDHELYRGLAVSLLERFHVVHGCTPVLSMIRATTNVVRSSRLT